MRINEDFIEQDGVLDQISSADISIKNPAFIMQDRRPVVELLREWDSILYLEIGDWWNKEPDYLTQVEKMVVKYTSKLRDVLERLPFRVEMSSFVVGSGMTSSQWDGSDDGGGFTTFLKYLLNQTEDDKGIQKITKLFVGIRLKQDVINLQKTFVSLSHISNIIFKLTKVLDFMIIYKGYSWNEFYIYSGKGIGYIMKRNLEKDIEDACVKVEPNFYGIDRWMEMLCVLSRHDRKEITCSDYDFTMNEIRKFREMLRTKNI